MTGNTGRFWRNWTAPGCRAILGGNTGSTGSTNEAELECQAEAVWGHWEYWAGGQLPVRVELGGTGHHWEHWKPLDCAVGYWEHWGRWAGESWSALGVTGSTGATGLGCTGGHWEYGCFWEALGATGGHWEDWTGVYWMALGVTGSVGVTGGHWDPLDCTGGYWGAQGPQGWGVLGVAGGCWCLLGALGALAGGGGAAVPSCTAAARGTRRGALVPAPEGAGSSPLVNQWKPPFPSLPHADWRSGAERRPMGGRRRRGGASGGLGGGGGE